MNTLSNAKYNQKGLTSRDIFTPEEIKNLEGASKKFKKGTAVAVGASTILISSMSANAEFAAKILPNHMFGEKTVNTIVMDEIKKPVIEVVENKKTESVEEKKETTVSNTPIVQTVTLAEAKANSEKAIEAQIETLPISAHEAEFLNAIKEGAFQSWEEFGVLPSVLTAQAVLESDWGTSELAMHANALFGVKASYWKGKTYTKRTREVYDGKETFINAAFRAYDSWTESMIDHGKFLNKERYAAAIGEKDYTKSITAIASAGYATDPEYVAKITNVIKNNHLDKWDQEVLGAYDAYVASIGPADMDTFVEYLNTTTSENRLEKIAKLSKEDALATFKAVGAEAMKNWKNGEMESLFKAFQNEEMNHFLHGDYHNKYLDRVAELALVIINEETPTKEQATQLRAMQLAIEGQVKVGDLTLTDKEGIQVYPFLEEKINQINAAYNAVTTSRINANFSGKVIVLDPGHGGQDGGAPNVYANGKNEATHNLTLVNALKQELESLGATVFLTNDGSSYVNLSNRVKFAVEKNADIFFSIHFNSNADRDANGTEIFYNKNSAESQKLAKSLFPYQKEALHTLETRGNGANAGNYEVLRTANDHHLTAVLTEALFMSNPYEILLLDNDNVETSLVNGYVAGLADYFGLEKEEAKAVETTSDVTETPDAKEEKVEVSEETKKETEETVSEEATKETETETAPAENTESPKEVKEIPTQTNETENKEEVSEKTDTPSSPTAEENTENKDSFFLFDMFKGFAN